MATSPRRTPAHQLFVNLLFSYHEQGGKAPKDEIAAIAARIGDLYPEYRGEGADGLSAINIYKILRGDHRKLPTSPQLGTLVLALQHIAHQRHILPRDPGCAVLPGWQALLSQARMLDRHQRAQGRFIGDAEQGVDRPLHLPSPPASAAPASAAPIDVPAIELTPVEVHDLVALGHHARTLALRATDADHRAFYEIAVALGTAAAPYNERAAVFALAAAAAAPVPSPASDLLTADAAVDIDKAAAHARVLAHAAAGHDDEDAARTFTRCADRAGNPALRAQAPQLRD